MLPHVPINEMLALRSGLLLARLRKIGKRLPVKRIFLGLMFALLALPAFAQTSLLPTLERLRPLYPTPMSPAQLGDYLNRVAWEHRSEGWGLHRKTGGSRCPSPKSGDVSCDILVHNPTGGVFDVLIDGTGAGVPYWRYIGPCAPAPGGGCEVFVPPTRPTGAPDPADLVVDFGPGQGTWVLNDGTSYHQLHTLSPGAVATGDMDRSGIDEVILDFGPGSGVWVWANNVAWWQLHTLSATTIVTADLDGNGFKDVILDFPGSGIWVYANNQTWGRLHMQNATRIVAGNIDGVGGDDLIIEFPGQGIWTYRNNSAWFKLHDQNAQAIATGDIDGNGWDE